MKHFLVASIILFLNAGCLGAGGDLGTSACLAGDQELVDKLREGLKSTYLSYDLKSTKYILIEGPSSDELALVRAYVEGIVSEGEDKAYGNAHWLVTFRVGEIDSVQSIPGNASSYFEFDSVSTEIELWLYETGYWSAMNDCE